ncbi:hypothetical protein JB92DRAFT_2831874 [Gautieria morchelliformis]|nr:hypothetical protein JB92DRAFT_2831874 [Gautieria morchelliformis]
MTRIGKATFFSTSIELDAGAQEGSSGTITEADGRGGVRVISHSCKGVTPPTATWRREISGPKARASQAKATAFRPSQAVPITNLTLRGVEADEYGHRIHQPPHRPSYYGGDEPSASERTWVRILTLAGNIEEEEQRRRGSGRTRSDTLDKTGTYIYSHRGHPLNSSGIAAKRRTVSMEARVTMALALSGGWNVMRTVSHGEGV